MNNKTVFLFVVSLKSMLGSKHAALHLRSDFSFGLSYQK